MREHGPTYLIDLVLRGWGMGWGLYEEGMGRGGAVQSAWSSHM